jgi:hypothetical protein
MEDAHQRSLVRGAGEGPARDQVPALPRAIDRRQQARAAGGEVELDPGPLVTEADHVAVVAGLEGAASEPEVEGLEEVRLAGSVRAVNHHDAAGDRRRGIGEVAEPAALDSADDHRDYTFRRIGITR